MSLSVRWCCTILGRARYEFGQKMVHVIVFKVVLHEFVCKVVLHEFVCKVVLHDYICKLVLREFICKLMFLDILNLIFVSPCFLPE